MTDETTTSSILSKIKTKLVEKNYISQSTPYYKMHEALYTKYDEIPYVNPYTGDTLTDLKDTVANTKLQLKQALIHKNITYCTISGKLVYLSSAKFKEYHYFFDMLDGGNQIIPYCIFHETEFYKGQYLYFKLKDNFGNILKGDYLKYYEELSTTPSSFDYSGYYYEGSFYSNSSHTSLLTPVFNKVYKDLSTSKYYKYTYNISISPDYEEIDSSPVENVTYGYYYNNEFYSDSEHTSKITPQLNKYYKDVDTEVFYEYKYNTLEIDDTTGICKIGAVNNNTALKITYKGRNNTGSGGFNYSSFETTVTITIKDDPYVSYCPQSVSNISYHTSDRYRGWSNITYNSSFGNIFTYASCSNVYNKSSNNLPNMPKGLNFSNFKLMNELPTNYDLTGRLIVVFTDNDTTYGTATGTSKFLTVEHANSYNKSVPYQALIWKLVSSEGGYSGVSDYEAPKFYTSHRLEYNGDTSESVKNIFDSSFYVEVRWGTNGGKGTCSKLELKGFAIEVYYRPKQTPMT